MSKLLRMMRRLRNPSDLWLFLQIFLMLIFLPRRIRRQSLPDLLAGIDPGVAPGARDEAKLRKTAGFADSLLKYRPFQRYGKCLMRSLVLFRFLRLQGWPVEIHFGVRRTDGHRADITGHSWLVLDGAPFLEDEHQQNSFAKTYSYPH
ncbi:MAG: lasso peptide biosynthesis B2 protein [Thermoleophilia bacterium]|nr:lasso peptide biosynthesis B2 protein [Thermoleophilia bacterium]